MSTKPLYFASLSIACIGAGVLAIYVVGDVAAGVGVAVLLAVAAIVLVRRGSRLAPDPEPSSDTTRIPLDVALPEPEGLAPLSWDSSYECGHPVIDAQHRRLFEFADALVGAAVHRHPKQHVEAMLDDLVEHIKIHFAAEEAVLARTGYPLSNDHQRIHGALLDQAKSLRIRYAAGEIKVRDVVSFVVHDVIAEHIVKEDLRFALRSPTLP